METGIRWAELGELMERISLLENRAVEDGVSELVMWSIQDVKGYVAQAINAMMDNEV